MVELTGGIPLEGKVRNLQGSFTEANNLLLQYEVEQIADNPNFQTAIIFDGVITDKNPNAELNSEVVIDSQGSHSLDVKRIPVNSQYNSTINYGYGNTVYLNWEHSTDTDTAYYIIKRDSVEIGRLSNVIVDEKVFEYSGANSGRYSVIGKTATPINDFKTVSFGTDSFTFNGTTYDFLTSGITYQLDYGVQLTLHDSPNTYVDFDIFIGVQSFAILKNQPEGENTYSITAYDIAGNEGNTVTKTVWVHTLPDGIVFDETTRTITNFGNATKVNVYSDYLPANDIWLDYVYEDAPVEELTAFNPSVLLPIGAKYYVWPVVDGIEHRNLELYEVPDPAIEVGTLSVPADLVLTPIANGGFTLSFTYEVLVTDKANVFRLYFSLDGNNYILFLPTFSVDDTSNIFGTINEYVITVPSTYVDGTTVYFKLVACDSNFLEGEFSEVVSGVADALAPVISGSLNGANI